MRYQTSTGGFITAANIEAAKALAAQYGMGEVVGAAAPIKKARKAARLRPIGVWDDLTESWELRPTTDYAAVKAALANANKGGGHPVLVAVTPAGRFVAPTRAEMAQL